MRNPILERMNPNSVANGGGNNPIAMLQQFAEFKRQMQGKNPEAIVNDLLRSGKMSQQQFEQLKMQAQSFQMLFK